MQVILLLLKLISRKNLYSLKRGNGSAYVRTTVDICHATKTTSKHLNVILICSISTYYNFQGRGQNILFGSSGVGSNLCVKGPIFRRTGSEQLGSSPFPSLYMTP